MPDFLQRKEFAGAQIGRMLKRIKESGDIFFAVSDREWILDGANVHVTMIGFDDGTENTRMLDLHTVASINANLSSQADISSAELLTSNKQIGFIGVSMHGPFDLDQASALSLCTSEGNPTGLTNSDVVRPILNAFEITKRAEPRWIIGFPPASTKAAAALYAAPFAFIEKNVWPIRKNNHRKTYREHWWIHGEPRPDVEPLARLYRDFWQLRA